MERIANVRFSSNVYPVSTENVANDPVFRRQVRGRSALKKLVECVYGDMGRDELYEKSLVEMGVEAWQLRLSWHLDIPCAFAEGDNPYGLVLRDGAPSIECRCIRESCERYKACHSGR